MAAEREGEAPGKRPAPGRTTQRPEPIHEVRQVAVEVLTEALVRLDAERGMLRRLDLARTGQGAYARVPVDLLDLVPRIALAVTAPARHRLAVELDGAER
jgi:hypothetical protein